MSNLWSQLTGRVFISHSYQDKAEVDGLVARLPEGVEPVRFPFEEPDPKRAVSNGIVPKSLSCGNLVHLRGGYSAKSLWVDFERDYARRARLKVFEFDPKTGQLSRDEGAPTELRIELVVGAEDESRAEGLLRWMREDRFFDFATRPTRVRMKEIPGLVARLIHNETIVVWLMNAEIGADAELALNLPTDQLFDAYARAYNAYYLYDESDFDDYAGWLSEHSMYVRCNPDWHPKRSNDPDVRELIEDEYPIERQFAGKWAVDLVPSVNDQLLDWNRADDLIVRLTYMLQRSRPFLPDADDVS